MEESTSIQWVNCNSLFSGALGDDDKKDDAAADDGEDPEVAEARREAEEKRVEKHRKMEEERENVRQSIRDKVSCLIIKWLCSKWLRSGSSQVGNTLDYQSRDRKIDSLLLLSFGWDFKLRSRLCMTSLLVGR